MDIIIAKITDRALLSPSTTHIYEGTEVVVKITKKPKHGEIVMVKKDNLILFRRLEKSGRKRILTALNTDFKATQVDKSVEIIGVMDTDATKILNYYRTLNAAQKDIYFSMMQDFSIGKMSNPTPEDLEKYTNNIMEKLKLAA